MEAVRAATRDPRRGVFATNATADWLLWRIPDLRGRVAYDARFELYDHDALDRIKRTAAHEGLGEALDGVRVVLVRGAQG